MDNARAFSVNSHCFVTSFPFSVGGSDCAGNLAGDRVGVGRA